MINEIKSYCIKHALLKPHTKVIVGLSGGPDSVFLLHALMKLKAHFEGLTIVAAHVDHGWREESKNDASFCKEVADSLGIQFYSTHGSVITIDKKHQSKEDLGRIMRRTYFERLAQEINADAIALGHHADDQEETFFIRLIRGSSLHGLASIRPKHGIYIRPLLHVFKREIVEYLRMNSISYVIDQTNSSDEFLRNRVRKNVIPALRAIDERFDNNCLKTIDQLQKTDVYLQHHTMQLLSTIKDGNKLNLKELLALHEYIQQPIVQAWLIENKVMFPISAAFFKELFNFLKKHGTAAYRLHKVSLKKQNGYLFIEEDSEQVQYSDHLKIDTI